MVKRPKSVSEFHNNQFFNDLKFDLPSLTDEQIGIMAENISSKNIYDRFTLNIPRLRNVLSNVYNVEFDFRADLPTNVLGQIELNPLKISLKPIFGNEEVWRFILAHEIGHLILHSNFLREKKINSRVDTEVSVLNYRISDNPNDKLELQANKFAGFLLMPDKFLNYVVTEFFKERDIYKPNLYWDNQLENNNLVLQLIGQIMINFGVSRNAATRRVIGSSYVIDAGGNSLKGNEQYNHY